MKTIFGVSMLVPLLAACASAGGEPRELSARDQAREASWLDGRTAGTPETCINSRPGLDSTVIGNSTILYRDGNTVYRNDVGSCPGLSANRTLITRTPTSRLCRGDIVQIADLTSGMQYGSCVLGDFVPYRE